MKRKPRKKYITILSAFIVLLTILSGCTVVFRDSGGNLTNDEKFYLQSPDGTTIQTDLGENLHEVDPSTTVGGFIESPLDGQTVNWVPRYTESSDGYTYYELKTEVGRPTKVPTAASVQDVLINPLNPNQVLVSINVLDQYNKNVDGYTHVFVNESSPRSNITFYDFDFVTNFPFGAGVDPSSFVGPGWNNGDSTSTVFGNYQVDTSFFNKFSRAIELGETPIITTLLDSENPNGLEENTASPKSGVTTIFTTINNVVWEKGNFSLDLMTGSHPFTTLNVDLPQLKATTTGNGTVQVNWPKAFGNVNGYHIFQDGQKIAEVNGDTTTYEVKNLSIGNNYEFTVKGIVQNEGDWVESTLALSSSLLVTDTVSPVLTISGDNPMIVDVYTSFNDPGITAVDQFEGDLTDNVTVTGQVDVHTPGEYTLVYRVVDQAGNEASATRLVKVVDKKSPLLTLKGDSLLSLEQGSTFTDPGITAIDEVDGDLASKVTVSGQVDLNTPGDYSLVYQVSDQSGNKAEITRIVKVKGKDVAASTQNKHDTGVVQVVKEKVNNLLPDTSTNQYNLILAGVLVILLGVLIYLITLKRRAY